VARNPQEQQADFSNAVAAFQGAIEAIKKLGDDLAGLDSVKTEMATAAQAIGAAVEGLPAAVGQSLTAVSSNVAREIAEELKQHYTITAQLVAIYGDSQITVKETAKLAQTLVAQGEDNVKSLKELASLPKANRLLAESIAKWQTTAEQLNAAGARLDELSRRWTELSGALDGKLESVNGKVQALGGATAALSGMLKEAAKQKDLTSLSGTITTSFNSLKRDVEALDESTRKADSAELAGIREVLAEMKRLSDQNIWKKLFGG
jgi:ABC-type transporter Mla subunit MlaD